MKIHIMGASCAGSTTLGQALSQQLNCPYFDTDAYFWAPSDVPYTVKREPQLRNQMLLADLQQQPNWILGGSVIKWGDDWKKLFDLVVFLYLPPSLRMQRLQAREVERYGDEIFTNPERARLYSEFIDWSAQYDNPDFTGRNIAAHKKWLTELTCPILEIEGDTTIAQRVELVIKEIERHKI